MLTFTQLCALSDEGKLQYLKDEVEALIASASPKHVLRLRALQARLDGIRAKVKSPHLRAEMIYKEMMSSFNEMNDMLKQISKTEGV